MSKKYYIYSEGFSNVTDDGIRHFGRVSFETLTYTKEYGWEVEDVEDTYIVDKWGGNEIVNLPDQWEPEFTNGLIQGYQGRSKKKAMEDYKTFIHEQHTDYNDIDIWK